MDSVTAHKSKPQQKNLLQNQDMSQKMDSKSWLGSKTLGKLIKNPKLDENQVQNTNLDSVFGYKPKQSLKLSIKSR